MQAQTVMVVNIVELVLFLYKGGDDLRFLQGSDVQTSKGDCFSSFCVYI